MNANRLNFLRPMALEKSFLIPHSPRESLRTRLLILASWRFIPPGLVALLAVPLSGR